MDRSEYLKICKRCSNKKFDINKGVICGLTGDIANFENECADYREDQKAAEIEIAKEYAKANPPSDDFGEEVMPERILSSGANWFYWIAGLSLINSLLLLTEAQFGFIVGLGISQFFDGIIIGIFGEYSILSLIPSLAFSFVFASLGYFANKSSSKAFVAGMIFYGLDALIFLVFGDYLSLGFHVFALFMIFKGYRALKEIRMKERAVLVNNAR